MKMCVRMRWAGAGLLVFGASVAIAESGGPIPSVTGAPGEIFCTECHSDFVPNTGGAVTIVNAPPYYKGGSTYTMTVRVASGQTVASVDRAWGFQLTAIDAGGSGAGTFANVDGQATKILAGGGSLSSRRYIEHDGAGTRNGMASPASWDFRWTAPPTGSGPITFHFVGLAANGTGSEVGDWGYHGSAVMGDSSTAAVPTSWGAVKGAYR